MAKLFANSGDHDQMPQNAASDLGLHCLLVTLLRVSRLQWVNQKVLTVFLFLHENLYVVGTHQKHLSKALLMNTHNIYYV